jgi:invasion protein IalB
MSVWIARTFARAFAVMLMLAAPTVAWAQAPAQPAPRAPAPPAPKAQAQPKAAPQPTTPPGGGAQAAAPAAGNEVPPLMYSPWTKVCAKGEAADAKQVCFTGKEGRLPDNGMMVIGAVVVEQDGSPNKMLRITVPLGMMVQPGTRLIVDQGQPMNAPFAVCLPQGCIAELEASQELIGKFKKGQSMVVQAVSGQTGGAISLPVPLPDFAKAYDGPPTDPKVLEERQKKLIEELQKKQQAQQQPGAPAPK